jgi:hypothetical protein
MQFHPGFRERPETDPQADPMLVCDAGERFGDRRRAAGISSDNLEHHIVHEPISRARKVLQLLGSRRHRAHELSRAIDLAERPKRDGQIGHRGNADILAEAEGEVAVSLRLENRQGLFEVRASLNEISRKPKRHSVGPMRDARLRRSWLRRTVAQERLSGLAHRRQLAAHIASRPEPVIDRVAFRHVRVARGQFVRAPEGRGGFGRRVTVRGDHRVSV